MIIDQEEDFESIKDFYKFIFLLDEHGISYELNEVLKFCEIEEPKMLEVFCIDSGN